MWTYNQGPICSTYEVDTADCGGPEKHTYVTIGMANPLPLFRGLAGPGVGKTQVGGVKTLHVGIATLQHRGGGREGTRQGQLSRTPKIPLAPIPIPILLWFIRLSTQERT